MCLYSSNVCIIGFQKYSNISHTFLTNNVKKMVFLTPGLENCIYIYIVKPKSYLVHRRCTFSFPSFFHQFHIIYTYYDRKNVFCDKNNNEKKKKKPTIRIWKTVRMFDKSRRQRRRRVRARARPFVRERRRRVGSSYTVS